eukprot:TRINITY_DN1039_c9_g1_i1.p1 TRINITY_DN1039_c9_g1~~TRINITY_DN1039_c9_g1_i1.p1  ORF type:complete len:523 (+),score=90.63 TRINITY_DN1039_c9_g1_i1:81-1571(+)
MAVVMEGHFGSPKKDRGSQNNLSEPSSPGSELHEATAHAALYGDSDEYSVGSPTGMESMLAELTDIVDSLKVLITEARNSAAQADPASSTPSSHSSRRRKMHPVVSLLQGARSQLDSIERQFGQYVDPEIYFTTRQSKHNKLSGISPVRLANEGREALTSALSTVLRGFNSIKTQPVQQNQPVPDNTGFDWPQFVSENWSPPLGGERRANNYSRTWIQIGKQIAIEARTKDSAIGAVLSMFEAKMLADSIGTSPSTMDKIKEDRELFQQALSQHLFKIWRLCLESEDARQKLKVCIENTVQDQTEESLLSVWMRKFGTTDSDVEAKICSVMDNKEVHDTDTAMITNPKYKDVVAHLQWTSSQRGVSNRLNHLTESLAIVHAAVSEESNSGSQIGADGIVPIFIHCILLANPPNMYSISEYLSVFAPAKLMNGNAGWAQATLHAALLFILGATPQQLKHHLHNPLSIGEIDTLSSEQTSQPSGHQSEGGHTDHSNIA